MSEAKSPEAQDQRRHARFKTTSFIRAFGPRGNEIQSESALVNISEGGLLFYSTEELQPKSHIKINIEIPDFNSSIAVGGEVTWAQCAMERPGHHFVGVKFIEMDESHRGLIKKLADTSS